MTDPFTLLVSLALVWTSCGSVHARTGEPSGKEFVERLSRTSDVLFYGDTPFLMDRSPLSVFAGYLLGADAAEPSQHVFSLAPGSGPVYYEKNYSAAWRISGDTLYLNDLNPVFIPAGNDPDSAKRALCDAVEKATGLRLAGDGKAMPATWFSGRLYIKRARTAVESYSDWGDSPFHELSVERGRVTACRRIGRREPAPASDYLKKRMNAARTGGPFRPAVPTE